MKMLPILVISIFSLSSICLLACHKSNENPRSSKYFPNDVGDTWVYDVTDSSQSTVNNPSTPTHYSVKVSITGIKKLSDGKDAAIWQYQYPSGNDTNYVRLTDDTLKIFENGYISTPEYLKYPMVIFIIPFEVSKRWNGKIYGIDSTKVVGTTDLNAAGQSFKNCFDIYHHYIGPNQELNDHYIFKPSVGMVSKKFIHFLSGPVIYQSWNLKSFAIH